MSRSIRNLRHHWAHYLLAPLAPAALCFIGCDAETNTAEMEAPNLESEWVAGGSTPQSEIACVLVTAWERNFAQTPYERRLNGMRLLPTSDSYNHVGGAVYTNANGEATLYVKKNQPVTFLYNHPWNYKLAEDQLPYVSSCAYNPNSPCTCKTSLYFTLCGNGTLQGSQVTPQRKEQCDDGNTIDYDGCTNACMLPVCGDGITQPNTNPPEKCDDGNTVNGDACDSNCTLPACGNGIKAGSESCDDGNLTNGDGCDSNCTPTGCGNGIVTTNEICDDNNSTNGDGCDSNCKPTGCGNGIVTAGEICDDGNSTNGDGCDSNCTPTTCGNGIKTAGEGCDDSNLTNGDGCNSTCFVESNSPCTTNSACASGICLTGNVCGCTANNQCPTGLDCGSAQFPNRCILAGCGNGNLGVGEGCDDGNVNNGDGCSSACKIELGYGCTTVNSAACASGFCDPADNKCECDTSNDCPPGKSCLTSVNPNQCVPYACGNGIVEPNETCDDGNLVSGDGCDFNCTPTGCGNGVRTGTEECDDGNSVNGDGCDINCTTSRCGNNIVGGTEKCDDGNVVNGDGCDSNCTPTGCGNGIVTTGEQCDDGNTSNLDSCTNICHLAACGDGYTQAGESCDDGNTNNLDACNNSCVASGGTIATGSYNGAANGADEGYAVAGIGESDILVAGNTTIVAQGRDAWVGRFAKTGGAPLWSTSFNGPANGNDYAYGVAADASPSVKVVLIGAETTSTNGLDIFIRKYDPTTSQAIKATAGSSGDDIGYDVAVDSAGNIAAAGVFAGTTQSFWIARYNANLTPTWTRTYLGSTGFVIGSRMSVAMDSSGNVTACGFELSQTAGNDKIWVIKYSYNGTLLSAVTFNAPLNYHPNAVTTDLQGNVIATGSTPTGDGDTWTEKFTSVGALLWSDVHNGSLNGAGAIDYWDSGNDVTSDSLLNVLVTGYTYEQNQGINIWVRKLSPTGAVLWTNRYNGPANANDYGMGIAVHTSATSQNNVLVTGYEAVSGQSSNVWVRSFGP